MSRSAGSLAAVFLLASLGGLVGCGGCGNGGPYTGAQEQCGKESQNESENPAGEYAVDSFICVVTDDGAVTDNEIWVGRSETNEYLALFKMNGATYYAEMSKSADSTSNDLILEGADAKLDTARPGAMNSYVGRFAYSANSIALNVQVVCPADAQDP